MRISETSPTSGDTPVLEDLNTKVHDRDGFTSANEDIDRFLKKVAGHHMKKRGGKPRGPTWTMVIAKDNPDGGPKEIMGFYSVMKKSYPAGSAEDKQLGVEGRDAQTLLIAQMGVDEKYKGTGLSKALMASALEGAQDVPGLDGVSVDPLHNDQKLRDYYARAGFDDPKPTADNEAPSLVIPADQVQGVADKLSGKAPTINLSDWRQKRAEMRAAASHDQTAAAAPPRRPGGP